MNSSRACIGSLCFSPFISLRHIVRPGLAALRGHYSAPSNGEASKYEGKTEQRSKFEKLSDNFKRINNNMRRSENNHSNRYNSTVHYPSKGFKNDEYEHTSTSFKNRRGCGKEGRGDKYDANRDGRFSRGKTNYEDRPERENDVDPSSKAYFKQRPFEAKGKNSDFHSRSNPAWKSNVRMHLSKDKERVEDDYEPSKGHAINNFKRNHEKRTPFNLNFKRDNKYQRNFNENENEDIGRPKRETSFKSFSRDQNRNQTADRSNFESQYYDGNEIKRRTYMRNEDYKSRGFKGDRDWDYYSRKEDERSFAKTSFKHFDEKGHSRDGARKFQKPAGTNRNFSHSGRTFSKQIPTFEKIANGYDKNTEPLYSMKTDKKSTNSEANESNKPSNETKTDVVTEGTSTIAISNDGAEVESGDINDDDVGLGNDEETHSGKQSERNHQKSLSKLGKKRTKKLKLVHQRLAAKRQNKLELEKETIASPLAETGSGAVEIPNDSQTEQEDLSSSAEATTPITTLALENEAKEKTLANSSTDGTPDTPSDVVEPNTLNVSEQDTSYIVDETASESHTDPSIHENTVKCP